MASAGTLASVLGDKLLTITSLKIIGEINGTDVKRLRQMSACNEFNESLRGKLTNLDLSETTIVEGGTAYKGSNYTTNNEIGELMFSSDSSILRKIILPNSVTKIGREAFMFCRNLTNVILGNKITTIGLAAFCYCEQLSNITIPNSVITIDGQAFINCNLTEIIIPNNVTTIGERAFTSCANLTSVTIGNKVETIGWRCFYSSLNISEVICLTTIPPTLEDEAFPILNTLKVPQGLKTVYKGSDWINYFMEVIELNN